MLALLVLFGLFAIGFGAGYGEVVATKAYLVKPIDTAETVKTPSVGPKV
jgi:hypothetical protein